MNPTPANVFLRSSHLGQEVTSKNENDNEALIEKNATLPNWNIYAGWAERKEVAKQLCMLLEKDSLVISHLEDLKRCNVDFLRDHKVNYSYLHDLHLGKETKFTKQD